jgi:nitrate reductase gamma subunit
MLFFIGQVLPYIAAAVFVIGTCLRVAVWLKAPVPFPLTLFPAANTNTGRMLLIGREILFFDSLRRGDKWLWLWAWLLHISLVFIIIGHIAGIYYLTKQFTLIGFSAETSSVLSGWLGTIFGMVFLAALLVLFYRRLTIPEVKRLSDPADYFILGLLLAIVVTGMYMRLASDVDLPAVRAFMAGLFTLHPVPIPKHWVFISHFALVNILLLYFPFSKLIHMVGIIINRAMITELPPVYPPRRVNPTQGSNRSISLGEGGCRL